ncbi:MAG: hypothetical protein J7K65_03880, partial [Planctomycetes bacterium]|nr:hypothetical protein [Planctomycetota bacterium]
ILALMVMLVLLLSMSSLALIRVGTEARLRTVKSDLQTAARFAADAGIERALYLMNEQLTAGTWTLDDVPIFTAQPLTAANADYTVTFTGNLSSGYQVTSVGHSNNQTKTVLATIALTSPIAKDFAIFAKDSIDLKNGSIVDGFNSDDPGDTDVPAKIGSLSTNNGAINLDNNVTVNGDVYIAPGGDPDVVVDVHSSADIVGDIFFLPSYYSLPTISSPDYTASQGSIAGTDITLYSADSGKYSDINIATNGTLSINGDLTLYITGDIILKNNAEIEVENNSTLILYFDGDIEAKNSSGLNNQTEIPANLVIYGTGTSQKIDIKNSGDIYAVIYAPNADMTVHNSVDVYGSFIVGDMELKNGGNIYYDKALKQVSVDDELVQFSITHWEEI